MKNFSFHIYLWQPYLLFLIGLPCFSQEKRQLTVEDYKLWNTLHIGALSDDGNWTSYSKSYLSKADTLFLKSTITDVQYTLAGGYGDKITADGSLFAWMRNDSLFLLRTVTGKTTSYPNVSGFELLRKGSHLIYLSANSDHNSLTLYNFFTGRSELFENVIEYRLNPQETKLSVVQHNENETVASIIDLQGKKKPKVLAKSNSEEFQYLTWNKAGTSLAFYSFDANKGEHAIILASENGHIKRLDRSSAGLAFDSRIFKGKLYLTEKGDKVFFDVIAKTDSQQEQSQVRVWRSSDMELRPTQNDKMLYWHVWLPERNKVYQVEDDKLRACALTDNDQKVVLLDNEAYLPFYKYNDYYSDVYLLDLATGDKKKIIEKQLRVHKHLVANKDGEFIAYFKDSNWWCYNIKKDLRICLTKNLDTHFNKFTSDRLDQHQAYGFGGWTTSGQLLLYDEFDIWLISPSGDKKQKITAGEPLKIKYQVYFDSGSSIRDGFFGFSAGTYELAEDLILKTINTEDLSEGFGIWNSKTGFQKIIHQNSKIMYVRRSGKRNTFQYMESSFDVSPQLISLDERGQPKLIAKSNEQQEKFFWGKSEIIHYYSPDGKKLNGALFYPAVYKSDKKYPMVVSIYENMASAVHEYIPPSLENYEGLNITKLTSEGYFVLLPDIAYVLNKPGYSALQCVLSAVDQAVKTSSIDEQNIGLIGHSFGGFETSYIVGHTNRFKTAVAGAGVTDLLSFYLDIDSSYISNMERFENSQFRNRIAFTDDEFLSESPIMNVKGINTPLLIWTGDNDQMVKSSYAIKMFAALWRLQKKSTMLIYPDEPHVIVNPVNQRDLTLKLTQWFDYQLKNSPKEDWMND